MIASQYRRLHKRQRGQCTWCGGPVPNDRRTWCSQDCVDAFLDEIKDRWQHRLDQLEMRDRGICALCGCDTRKARAMARELYPEDPIGFPRFFAAAGWPRDTIRQWWEADHIVARQDGGTHALSNLRTLCVPCHKARTAAWHRERTRRRSLRELRAAPHDHHGLVAEITEEARQTRLFAAAALALSGDGDRHDENGEG